MIADTDAELMEFAGKLGLRMEWKHKDHFDVSITFRKRALNLGAIEISQLEMAERISKMRGRPDLAEVVRRRRLSEDLKLF